MRGINLRGAAKNWKGGSSNYLIDNAKYASALQESGKGSNKEFAETMGWDEKEYEERIMREAAIENIKRKAKEEQEKQEAYDAEMNLLRAEFAQRNWLQSIGTFFGQWGDIDTLKDFVELPNGELVKNTNWFSYSPDINMVTGEYGDGYRPATPEEKKKYEETKKRAKAGYAESGMYRASMKFSEFANSVLNGVADMALDIPLLLGAGGSPMMRESIGLAIADFGLSQREKNDMSTYTGQPSLIKQERIELEKQKAALGHRMEREFAKMTGEEKERFQQDSPLLSYALRRSRDIDRQEKQKMIRDQIMGEATTMAGRDVKRFFNPNDVRPVNQGTINYNGTTYRLELEHESGNPWDAQELVTDLNGNPLFDEQNQPIYKDKYSVLEKYGNAIKNTPSLIFDSYNNKMVWDGVASAVSFLGIGKGSGALAGAVTKGIARGTEKALARGVTRGLEKAALRGLDLTEQTAKLSKRANTIQKISDKLATAVATTATSYMMTNAESQTIGQQTFNNVYKKFLEDKAGVNRNDLYNQFIAQGLTGEELEIAVDREVSVAATNILSENPEVEADAIGIGMAARRNAVTANNINTLMNLNYGAYFVKGHSAAKLLKPKWAVPNILKTTAYLAKEVGQEYIEEGITNQYAQLAAEALAEGKIMHFTDYLKEGMFEADNIEQGMLGALLGFGQSGIMEIIESVGNKREYSRLQKPYIQQFLNPILKYSKEDINQHLNNIYKGEQLTKYALQMEQAITEGKGEEVGIITDKAIANLAITSAINGTTEVLIENLTRLQQNENLDIEDKATIKNAIEFAQMVEQVYDDHSFKYKGGQLTELLVNSSIIEKGIESIKNNELTNIDAQIADHLTKNNLETLSEEHQLSKDKKAIEQQISGYELMVKEMMNKYTEIASPKGQEEARQAIKKAKKEEALKKVEKKNFKKQMNEVETKNGKATAEDHKKAVENSEKGEKGMGKTEDRVEYKEKKSIGNIDKEIVEEIKEADFDIAKMQAEKGRKMKDQVLKDENSPVFSPVLYNDKIDIHKTKVNEFKDIINRINKRIEDKTGKDKEAQFDNIVYAFKEKIGLNKTESAFDFLKEAYKKSDAYKGETEQFFKQNYNEWFGNDFLSNKTVAENDAALQNDKNIRGEENIAYLTNNVDNPITSENTNVFGRTVKRIGTAIAESLLKLPFLGTNYNTITDWENGEMRFEDSNNEVVNESALPFLDFYILRVGDSVTLKVSQKITKQDLDQPISDWETFEKNGYKAEVRTDKTFRQIIEEALPGRSADELIENSTLSELIDMEVKTRNIKSRRESEIARKFPVDLLHERMEISEGKARGLHDYYWYNHQNISNFIKDATDKVQRNNPDLRHTDPDAFEAQVEVTAERMREGVIKKSREQNMGVREQLLEKGSLQMEIDQRKPGYTLKNTDNSLNTLRIANPTVKLAVINKDKGGPIAGGTPIPTHNISNFPGFREIRIRNKSYNGARVMIYQTGVKKDGQPLYAITSVIDATYAVENQEYKKEAQGRMKKLWGSRELIHRAMYNHLDNTLPENIAKEINEWLEANKFTEKTEDFKELFPFPTDERGKPITNSKGDIKNILKDGEAEDFRYDIKEKWLNKNPILPIIEVNEGKITITSVKYQDSLMDNLMTDYKFVRIESKKSPTGEIYIKSIQPVITLKYPSNTEIVEPPVKGIHTPKEKSVMTVLEEVTQDMDKKEKTVIEPKISETIIDNKETVDNPNQEKKIVTKGEERVFTNKDYAAIKNNLLHNTLAKLLANIIDEKSEINIKNIKNILKEAFDELVYAHSKEGMEAEEQYLIDEKDNLLAESGEYSDSVVEDIMSIFNISEEDIESSEYVDEGGENITNYSQLSYERSVIPSMSQKLKALLAGIVDINNTEKTFGLLQNYVPLDVVVSGLQKAFSISPDNSLENLRVTIENLVKVSTSKETGKSNYAFLNNVLERMDNPKLDQSFIKQIQYTLYQNPVRMTFVLISSEKDRFRVMAMNADSKNEDRLKEKEWLDNLKQSSLINLIDSSTYTINKNTAERVKNLYEKFLKTQNKNEIAKPELKEFFNHFGISLNDVTIDVILNGIELNISEIDISNMISGIKEKKKEKGVYYANSTIDVLYSNMLNSIEREKNGKTLILDRDSVDNLILYDNRKNISLLVSLDNRVTFNPAISTFISGKIINAYSNPNLITEKIKGLKIAKGLDEKENEELTKLNRAAFSKNNLLVRMLTDHPELREFIGIDQVSLNAIKEKDGQIPDKNRIEDLSIRDYFLTTIGNFTQSYNFLASSKNRGLIPMRVSMLPFPTISDSGIMPLLKTFVYNLTENSFDFDKTNKDGVIKPKNYVLKEVFGQLVQPELDRIEAYMRNSQDANSSDISGMDFKSNIFHILPSFNTLLVKNSEGVEVTFSNAVLNTIKGNPEGYNNISELISVNENVILDNINRGLSTIVEDLEVLMQDNGFFNEKTGSIEKIDSKYFETRAENDVRPSHRVKIMLYDYVVNYLVNQTTVQSVFAGDIVNYGKAKESFFVKNENGEINTSQINFASKDIEELFGKENIEQIDFTELNAGMEYQERLYNHIAKETGINLSKRLKAILSPGNRLATEYKNYLQIVLEDTNSSSEVLQSLIKTWYPESFNEQLKIELDEFKKLDRIYNKNPEQRKEHKNKLKEFQNKFPKIKDYFENKTSDGQEWVTWKDALNQLKSQGRITENNYNTIYKKLESQSKDGISKENELTLEEMDMALTQPSKPLYSGLHYEDFGDYTAQRFVYIKSSSFPLLPQLTQTFELDKARKNLEALENRVQESRPGMSVRAVFDSAIKVGGFKNPLNMEHLYKDVSNSSENERNEYLDRIQSKSIEMDRSNFYIQQDKPFKTSKNIKTGKRDEISRSTQMEKIILGNGINKIEENIFPNLFDKSILEQTGIDSDKEMVSGQDLFNLYNEMYKQEQKLLKDRLFKELGISSYEDLARKEPAVYEKLSSLLNKRLSNKQDKESITVIYKIGIPVNGKYENIQTVTKSKLQEIQEENPDYQIINAEFKLPLWITPNSRKFEAVLGSIIKNNITKPKLPGSGSAVASEEGFRWSDGMTYEDYVSKYGKEGMIITKSFDGTLKSTRNEDGSLKSAQVLLANKFRVKKQGKDGIYRDEYLDLREYVKDGFLDTERIPQEMLEYFSYRIPTSAHQSGMLIEVVGFIPHQSGDLMIVPKDSTVQIGEDYDIDMRWWYQLNYTIDEKTGNLKRLGTEELITQAEIDKMKDDYKAYKEELISKVNAEKYSIWRNNREHLIELAFLYDEKKTLENVEPEVTNLVSAIELSLTGSNSIEEASMELEGVNVRIRELEGIIIPSKIVKSRQERMRQDMYSVLSIIEKNFKRQKNEARIKMNQSEDLYHKILENNIISLYKSVYKSTDARINKLISSIINTDFAESTANLIESAVSGEDNKPFTIYNPIYQQRIMSLGHSGMLGTAVHSNWVVFNPLLQQLSTVEEPIQLLNTEGEALSMQFGKMKFDGTLGKTDVKNGRQLSEINMENQNTAVDNQRLLIMGKRNENKHTINVFALMSNGDLDNDGIKINGKEYSYPSLFIAQPILRRYAELMDYYNSSTVQKFGTPMSKVKKQLIKEFGIGKVNWAKIDGQVVPGILDYKIKYGNREEGITGEVYKMTSENLYNQLLSNGGNFQWAVFEHFIELNSRTPELNQLQQLLNIEGKGIGMTFFDTIDIKNTLINLPNMESGISNVTKLIGQFENIETGADNFESTEKDLIEQGYVYIDTDRDGMAHYIKPKNFFSHKIVNTISTGYNLWKNLLPYDSQYIEQQINDIFKELKINPNTNRGREYKMNIIQAMKDYLFVNSKSLFSENGETLYSNRKRLFIDTENNMSLPALLNEMRKENRKDSSKYPIMSEAFFNSLEFEINKNDEPSLIKYSVNENTKLQKDQSYRVLKNLIDNDEVLTKGITIGTNTYYKNYKYSDLARDLLKYSFIANQENGAIGFRQHLPLALFDSVTDLRDGETVTLTEDLRINANVNSGHRHNVTYNGYIQSLYALMGNYDVVDGVLENIKNINLESIDNYIERINKNLGAGIAVRINDKGDVQLQSSYQDMVSNFVRQFIQHHSEDVKQIDHNTVVNIKKHYRVEGIEGLNEIEYGDEGEVEEESYTIPLERKFITLKEKGNTYLFENTGNSFRRINTLGRFGMNEYEVGKRVDKSLIEKNNINIPLNQRLVNTPKKINIKVDGQNIEVESTKEVSAADILISIKNNRASKYRNLASMLERYIPEGLAINYTSNIPAGYNGFYDGDTNSIFVANNVNQDKQQEVILEEVLHKITVAALKNYIKFTPNGSSLEVEFIGEGQNTPAVIKLANVYKAGYDAVYKELVKRMGKEKTISLLEMNTQEMVSSREGLNPEEMMIYRAKDINEFFAGMFLNPEFAEVLNRTEYRATKKSIAQNFIDAILRLFTSLFPGMKLNDNSILQETAEVLMELLENFYKDVPSEPIAFSLISNEMIETDVKAKNLPVVDLQNSEDAGFSENVVTGQSDIHFSPVTYQFSSVEKINNNLNRIEKLFTQLKDTDTFWNKIQKDFQISKNELNLIKEQPGDNINEKLTNFLANYSYVVEVNTAIEPIYDPFQSISDYNQEMEERLTQHYSNLTVPGGTNYTENEIATPLITPSIEGHARFSTENGIGWFRSDEKSQPLQAEEDQYVTIGDEKILVNKKGRYLQSDIPTKTRRVLEIESDLFQKGRNKSDLIGTLSKNLSKKEIVTDEDLIKRLDRVNITGGNNVSLAQEGMYIKEGNVWYLAENLETINSPQNQFLQLLNKDSNWVNFFIKSIVQDSANKGYEKVLFPSGETAAKVEGHQTLADEIMAINKKLEHYKEIEDSGRYNSQNEFLDIQYVREGENWYQEIEGDINKDKIYSFDEIVPTKKELESEKQRLKSQGIEKLKPIEKFYEIRVKNSLEKIYGKENINNITDEHANTWRELELNESHKSSIYFSPMVSNKNIEIEVYNNKFNEKLQRQIETGKPDGIYDLGYPSDFLLKAGIPDLPIELAASRLSDKANQENHPFNLSEVRDLPRAIQYPLAVFDSATTEGSFVILTELKQGDKNFVVAIETSRSAERITVNSIRSIHPRTTSNVINWINSNLIRYANKNQMLQWIEDKQEMSSGTFGSTPTNSVQELKPSMRKRIGIFKQQSNSADVKNSILEAAKIIQNLDTTKIYEENLEKNSQQENVGITQEDIINIDKLC